MENLEQKIANNLLQINAIKFNPANPFRWSSGWKSPIYCDNRKSLSYPPIRDSIKNGFVELVKNHYGIPDVIAGVATGAIAIGALTADALNLPFVYVRSSPKNHGLQNMVEGDLEEDQKVVVIEDLISTGNSSLNAVKALRNSGANVLGMGAIFSYEFELAKKNFEESDCPLATLCGYHTLIEVAIRKGYLQKKEREQLENWRKNPSEWE
ncbi:MAG: orotate phosphoribosyltransferase [Bacteroidales bacterium]|nr:orotate phosphoribosyltransferase [Bacteroidales bacterium]MBS3776006.1 orotate phosphoribosyltransferase [Bacteroidales bacterium]